MRAGASRASASATSSSTIPPPTATAMPPCAQALEAPWPSGAAEMRVTGRGASFSAQNRPARPPPTMTTSSVLRVRSWILSDIGGLHPVVPANAGTITTGGNCVAKRQRSVLQVDHPLDRTPRLIRNHRIDGDFLAQVDQAVENLRQRDPLHVRAEIA